MVLNPIFNFAVRADLQPAIDIYNSDNPEIPLKISDFLPKRADPECTGYDVRCAEPNGVILKPYCYVKVPLGIRMHAPQQWWLSLAPRSGTFAKRYIHALYGVIDETYENELVFAGQYLPDACKLIKGGVSEVIKFGERIAQVIPVMRQDMVVSGQSNEELDKMFTARNAQRGTGGFGSTGKV